MRAKVAVVLVALVVMGSCICSAGAADASINVPVTSGYLFRGLLLNDEAVFQPMLTVAGSKGFAVYVWGNMPLTDQNMFGADNQYEFSEVDVILEYTKSVGSDESLSANVSLVLSQYLYPDPTYPVSTDPATALNAQPTRELALVTQLDVLFSPTLSLYFDIDDADGAFYCNLKFSHSITRDALTVGASTSIGYANADYKEYYLGMDDGGLNELDAGLNLSYAIDKAVSVSASVTYCMLLDSDTDDAAEAAYNNDGDSIIGSVGLTVGF